MRRANRTYGVRSAVATLAVVAIPLAATGATLTWDEGGATDALSDPLNWNPNQAPGLGDDLVIGLGAFPFATEALSVQSITASRTGIRNGRGLTFSDPAVSYTLFVQDDVTFETRNNSSLSLQIDGVSGTGEAAVPGLTVGGDLTLDNDNDGAGIASLKLNSIAGTGTSPARGALARIGGQVLVGEGGGVEGSGVLTFDASPGPGNTPGLINNGQVVARYAGPPRLNAPPPVTELLITSLDPERPIDLDGQGSERGIVAVEDNAALRVAPPLTDPVSNQIQLGDGAVLWMDRPWTLESDLLAVSEPSEFDSVPDVATLRGARLTLDRPSSGVGDSNLFVGFGNRLVVEADVAMVDGDIQIGAGSVFEAAGEVLLGPGTAVRSAGFLDISGQVKVNDRASVQLLGEGLADTGLRVADGGTLEISQGGGVGLLLGSTSTVDTEIAAGGTLRFAKDFFGSSDLVSFQTPLTVAGRLEVEGDSGEPSPFGRLEAQVFDLTLTDDATFVSIAGVDGTARDFGTLLYSDDAVTLDGTLELRLDGAASADPLILDGVSDVLFVGFRSTPEAADPLVSGGFDEMRIVDDLTGEVVAGLAAVVQYNLPVGENGRATTVTFQAIGALLGDFNGNGQVEQGDLDLVLSGWGLARGSWSNAGTFTTPGVDQEELDAVLTNWGRSVAPSLTGGLAGGSAVPEPGVDVAGALLGWCVAWRRRCPRGRACTRGLNGGPR